MISWLPLPWILECCLIFSFLIVTLTSISAFGISTCGDVLLEVSISRCFNWTLLGFFFVFFVKCQSYFFVFHQCFCSDYHECWWYFVQIIHISMFKWFVFFLVKCWSYFLCLSSVAKQQSQSVLFQLSSFLEQMGRYRFFSVSCIVTCVSVECFRHFRYLCLVKVRLFGIASIFIIKYSCSLISFSCGLSIPSQKFVHLILSLKTSCCLTRMLHWVWCLEC